MSDAVQLQGVVKTFGDKVAVDHLDLTVPEGSIYGFIGPNGSGKTTTLRLMLRIYQPDAGSVAVLGVRQGSAADDRLGYLPEERGLYKRMKVFDLITYFARLKGFYDCRDEVASWLERLGAAEWGHQRVDTLSKGMAQKVQFIVAVIARPQLVILDEPFAGLDPVNLEVLKEAVLSLRAGGATVVFSTHDMNVAENLCDTIFMICEGRKVLDGSLTEIQNSFPSGRVRIRLAGDTQLPADLLEGVAGHSQEHGFEILSLDADTPPEAILQRLVPRCRIEHFEVVRPTLHDIFVDIARPQTNGDSA